MSALSASEILKDWNDGDGKWSMSEAKPNGRETAQQELAHLIQQCRMSLVSATTTMRPAATILGRIANMQQQGVDVAALNGEEYMYAGERYEITMKKTGVITIRKIRSAVTASYAAAQ